jgi:hypothetical protein
MILLPTRSIDQSALDALGLFLHENRYSQHAKERIVRHAAATGELAGCVLSGHLESEDEAGATGAFLRAMEAVPYDDPTWSDPSIWLDVDSIMDAAAVAAVEPPDDWKGSTAAGWALIPPELEDLELPPIAGGAPEPFSPSPEDWADYRAWSEALDARRPAPEPRYGYE